MSTTAYSAVIGNASFESLLEYHSETILDAIWLADISDHDKSRLHQILSFLISHKHVSYDLVKERLELDFLESANIIGSAQIWTRKQVRINTAQLYKQQRFNLYREETEGYSRLMVALSTSKTPLKDDLLQLVGHFDLDPNRVIEAIIDVAASTLNFGLVEGLLVEFGFPASTVSSIMGFKLGWLSGKQDQIFIEGLFLVIAACIKTGVFALEDIWPYLEQEDAKKEISKAGKDKAPSATDTLNAHDTGKELQIVTGQKYWLASSLLRFGLIADFEKVSIDFPVWNELINKSICAHILSQDSLLPENILIWLRRLGPIGLYHDHRTINIVVCQFSITQESFFNQWTAILTRHVFPSMSISYGNTALSCEVWAKIAHLPYNYRFALYATWKDVKNEAILLAHQHSRNDLKRLLRRLSKENVRQYGRLLGKLARANPIVVFPLLLEQCQAYDNLIPPVIDSCKYLTPLEYDVLVFSLLEQLSSKHSDPMKDDATNVASWLQRLAQFSGQLFRRYSADLRPVIEYLNARMSTTRTVELIVLSELLERLGGIESRWELSDLQIDILASGPFLKQEVVPKNKKTVSRLLSALDPITWPLIATQKEKIAAENLKLASTLVDQATACLLQYTEFIGNSEQSIMDPEEINKQLFDSLPLTIQKLFKRTYFKSANKDPLQAQSEQDLFWLLDLGDVHVPVGRYQSEIARLKTVLITADSKRDRDRAPQIIAALEKELKQRMHHAQLITQHCSTLSLSSVSIEDFIQNMIYPRCILSASDATFCVKWICSLIRCNVFEVFSCIVKRLECLLASQTEREAKNFSRFFGDLLTFLYSWHSDPDKFLTEARIPVSASLLLPDGIAKDDEPLETIMDYEQFKHELYNLYTFITNACCAFLTPNGEFLRLRSTIIFLSSINTQFPRVTLHLKSLLNSVSALNSLDTREDVKVLSIRLHASLQASKASVIKESQFHISTDTMDMIEDLSISATAAAIADAYEEQSEEGALPLASSTTPLSAGSSNTSLKKDHPVAKEQSSAPITTRSSSKRSRDPSPSSHSTHDYEHTRKRTTVSTESEKQRSSHTSSGSTHDQSSQRHHHTNEPHKEPSKSTYSTHTNDTRRRYNDYYSSNTSTTNPTRRYNQ